MSVKQDEFYTIQELAALVGVSTSALRAWERRYSFFRPQRTEGGHRLYTSDDMKLFWYISHLRNSKTNLRDISLHGRDELLASALTYYDERSKLDPEPRGSIFKIVSALSRGELFESGEMFAKIAKECESGVVFADIALQLMKLVGAAWERGELSVIAEHSITARARHLMSQYIYEPTTVHSDVIVICAAFPHEQHDLGLMRAAIYLRSIGCQVIYLGADTPISDLGCYVKKFNPNMMCLTAGPTLSPSYVIGCLKEISETFASKVVTVVGGAGVHYFSDTHANIDNIILLDDPKKMNSIVSELEGATEPVPEIVDKIKKKLAEN